MKVFLLFAVVAVAAASYSPAPAASRTGPSQRPVQPKQTGYDQQEHPYAFEYSVSDPYSGANFAQQEAGDGHSTQGRYSVALPDGRIQHVNYVADHHNGFNAEVTYEGEAQYPKDRPGQGYGAGTATNTAAGYNAVPAGGDITINTPILLDVSTPSMDTVTIATGGRLVFDSSVEFLKLTANMIELTGGELWIGSEDCPYVSETEVLLTGQRDETEGAASVQKAVLVREGVLEVHGKPKRPWTQLAATVPKTTRSEVIGNPIYSATDSDATFPGTGFRMIEFDSSGNVVKNWGRVSNPQKFNKVKDNTGSVVVVVLSKNVVLDSTSPDTADAFEDMCFGGSRQSAMASMVDGQRVAFAAVCHIGSPSDSTERVGSQIHYRSETGWVYATVGGVDFAGMSVVSLESSGSAEDQVEAATYTAGGVPSLEQTVELVDGVGTWKPGDQIAIASTDFDYLQAEVFEVLQCSSCSKYQVNIRGPVRYTHWGEVTDGVDMRAEVGVLTRNVRFHGEMEPQCYGGNLCDEFEQDTFGGQIKVLMDFTTVKIENAEFFHMGQQAVIGSYPIHFHMCLDTSSKGVYIRKNSIHHTFSRCLTIHGTHNVTVENNMAFDHFGHCYFLEDGGEQHNTFKKNLGFGTRPGTLLPTDAFGRVSTFWITNPDNALINNHAAGSFGIGIWILMPRLPTGPSASVDMGLVELQARRTILKAFRGNVAHSNRNFGFRLDDELFPDGTVAPDIYEPREDPTDPDSDPVLMTLDDFTAYKNSEGAWIKGVWSLLTNFRLAENGVGIIIASSFPEDFGPYYQVMANSRIVGETANIGEPAGEVTLESGEVIVMNRSIPRKEPEYALIGFVFYRGPLHLMDTSFAGFKANALHPAGAIGKKFSNPYFSSPINSVRNVTFDFSDPSEGARFYDGDGTVVGYEERDGNRHNVLLDWDGSLTTYPGSSLVRPIPVLTNAHCVEVPDWGPGSALCPDRFTRLRLDGVGKIPTFLTRNDLMASEVEVSLFEQQISYALNSAESYILHMNTTVPARFRVAVIALDQNVTQLVGVCVGASQTLRLKPDSYTLVSSLDELNADTTNSKYFYDSEAGVVMLRFSNPYARGSSTLSNCPGELDGDGNGSCLTEVTFILDASNDDGDCRERAYPRYRTEPVSADGALTAPTFN
ncbi:Cell surface hyaluronidase [Amphibalanus amphitrite]|uniref:Cell surface hyaluronidase n=1 Tax=Amphibalanus amphitrite TaxID=1232801 RepID=A0A6A4WFR9_AMPAM|nr:Cell surface hyaluronidase [Amphibalanus amphitrite]